MLVKKLEKLVVLVYLLVQQVQLDELQQRREQALQLEQQLEQALAPLAEPFGVALPPLQWSQQVEEDWSLSWKQHWQADPVGQQLLKSSVPVVIDHMGRVDAAKGLHHQDFQALMKLLDSPHFHVKVSGIDRIDSVAGPENGYSMGIKLATELVKRFPSQCVWGLDWPHPNHTHVPNDGILIDALKTIAPSVEAIDALLVHNPEKLYRFSK